jgi:hypothetical protein
MPQEISALSGGLRGIPTATAIPYSPRSKKIMGGVEDAPLDRFWRSASAIMRSSKTLWKIEGSNRVYRYQSAESRFQ